MNTETNFCLRVDVDTFEGLKKGIPKALEISKRYEIPITIYLSLGKYETGKNIFRKIKQRESVISKIPPWKRNSFKSLLRGTLLPGRRIGEKTWSYLQSIDEEEDVEIHPHGYNHVQWSSRLAQLSENDTRNIIEDTINEYTSIFKKKPVANAAPNFSVNKHYFQILIENKFEFSADFKYTEPFYLMLDKDSRIVQLPVTEPTIEEFIVKGTSIERIVTKFKKRFDDHAQSESKYVCFYFHAIYEPFRLEKTMGEILSNVQRCDFKATSHLKYKQHNSNFSERNIETLL